MRCWLCRGDSRRHLAGGTLSGAQWQRMAGTRRRAPGATGGSFPPSPELSARVRYLAAENETPRRLFAAIEVGGLLISDDDGAHWTQVTAGLDDPDVHQILASSRHQGVVIAVCGEGVYRSTDRGDHWQKITPNGARTFGSSVTEDGTGAIYLGIAWIGPTPGSVKNGQTPRFLSAKMAACVGTRRSKESTAASWRCVMVLGSAVFSPRHRKAKSLG